jgi:hypothetical protein
MELGQKTSKSDSTVAHKLKSWLSLLNKLFHSPRQPLTEWISHVLGPVGIWALTGHVALHSKALQG